MHRTQIYLDSAQKRTLRMIAAERSTTVSQLIREAIGGLVARYQKRGAHSSKGLGAIIGIYRDETDREGSTRHDDIYD